MYRSNILKMYGLVFLLFAATMHAANFYVDNAANGSNNGTSWENAWESFGSISWGSVKGGDKVFISGGSNSKTYSGNFSVSANGASGNPITISKGTDAGHSGNAIIEGTVTIDGRSYITVKNLSVRGQFDLDNVKYVIIDNNDIYITEHGGVSVKTSSNVVVSNNRMTTPDYTTVQTDGIYSGRNQGNIYENNSIIITNGEPNGHDDAIQCHLDDDITIRNNYLVQDNNKTSNAQGIYISESYGVFKIYNNIIIGNNTQNGLLKLLNLSAEYNSRIIAHHNTIIGGGWGIVRVQYSPESVLKNNIIMSELSGAYAMRIEGELPPASNIDYNIYYLPNSSIFTSVSGKKWSDWQNLGFDTHSELTNPMLESNYRLKNGSPAMDHGSVLTSEYNRDKSGILRPQGNGWDMGAYELQSGSTGSAPANPTSLRIK